MYLKPMELLRRAITELGQPTGVAASIPVPVGTDKIAIGIFFYDEPPIPTAHIIFPPKYLLRMHPETGVVLARGVITPGELGLSYAPDKPLPRHPDERRLKDADAFWDHYHQLMDIFQEAWEPYAQARARFSAAERARIVQCAELFDEVAEKRLLPFYEALAGPFFHWMGRVRARP